MKRVRDMAERKWDPGTSHLVCADSDEGDIRECMSNTFRVDITIDNSIRLTCVECGTEHTMLDVNEAIKKGKEDI